MARIAFGDRLIAFQGTARDPFPTISEGRKHLLLSFRSPWVVKANVLDQFEIALNFHPGSADYPGYGCYSFALYESAVEYGCVCHHMLPLVDSGIIVSEERFKLSGHETIEMLKLRTYAAMLSQFHDVVFRLSASEDLGTSPVEWSRLPFTRRQHKDLSTITTDMSPSEIQRRVRCTSYPGEGAFVVLGDIVFLAPVSTNPPLA